MDKNDSLNTLLSQVNDSIESEKDVIAVIIHKSILDLGFIHRLVFIISTWRSLNLFCTSERFNTNISQQLFDYKVTFVN